MEYAYIDVRDEYRDGKLFESKKSGEFEILTVVFLKFYFF